MKLIPVSSMDEVLDLVLEKSKNKTEGTDVPVRKNEKKNTKKKTKVKQTERA